MGNHTYNKGEWSELYTFLKILATGKLYAADENSNLVDGVFFPVLQIIRDDSGETINYIVDYVEEKVTVYREPDTLAIIPQAQLLEWAEELLVGIKSGKARSFEIPIAETIISSLYISKVVAPSSDKTDITIVVHDIQTGYDMKCGFSIKSELGNSPTLLNASKSTNFSYCVPDVTDIDSINSIDGKSKIMDRLVTIQDKSDILFESVRNETFVSNMLLIDTRMDEIIGWMLREHYKTGVTACEAIVEKTESIDPFNFERPGVYEYKMKKFLCAVALGLTPSKSWSGRDEANGGYIIVKSDGEVVAYHIYNRDSFEEYLLHNTRFERASTSRHEYAKLYKLNGKTFIDLNLQIRFK